MQTTHPPPASARAWLTHAFGCGLDGEDRITVERFRTMLDGDVRATRPDPPRAKGRRQAKHPVISRKEVEALRPARTEIIICARLGTCGGWLIYGEHVVRGQRQTNRRLTS